MAKNKRKITRLLIFFNLLCIRIIAQNMVPNGSFEEYKKCPTAYYGLIEQTIEEWSCPNKGTVDYYNSCSRDMGVPKNLSGTIEANEGNAYVGIALSPVDFSSNLHNREYIQVKLISDLKINQRYCIKFYVARSIYSPYAVDEFGIYLSDKKLKKATRFNIPVTPQFTTPSGNYIESSEWVQVCTDYIAIGGEKFITIGHFYTNENKNEHFKKIDVSHVRKDLIKDAAYYFIDNISIELIYNQDSCEFNKEEKIQIEKKVLYSLNNKVILENVFFETASATLKDESFVQINDLVDYLKTNTEYKVNISGHTDSIGNESENIILSKNRAETVANYLIINGVLEERIKFEGKGSSEPIKTNKTLEGREKNRRVEIIISQ